MHRPVDVVWGLVLALLCLAATMLMAIGDLGVRPIHTIKTLKTKAGAQAEADQATLDQ